MVRHRSRMIGAALAIGAIGALPGAASAHPEVAIASVKAHTDRVDAALAQATSLFAAGRDAKAEAAFGRSRSQTALAVAEAAKLVRLADTPAERAAAARALRLVATARAERIPFVVDLLGPADAAAERAIAKAALADARGRDTAIAVLNTLLKRGVPAGAQVGIGRAIITLSTDRDDEVKAEAKAAASAEVSAKSAATLAATIDVTLRGQARATAVLTALKDRLAAASARGLDRAIAAIAAEQEKAAEAIAAAAPGMPAPVAEFVGKVADRAADQAAGMRKDRPGPPAPSGGGAPEGTPSGPPAERPSSPTRGTHTGS